MPLILPAELIGKAATGGPHTHVTLKIKGQLVELDLLPDEAAVFTDISHHEGGAHPLYDPIRVVYSQPPSYTVTIAPVESATEPEPAESEPSPLATEVS